LSQVEPRTDVATLPGDATSIFLLSAPGSYYLSGNVAVPSGKSGVAIGAADVSLDLNGLSITGSAATLNGVELRSGANGANVRNGVISGVPAGPGLTTVANVNNVHLEK